MALGDKYYVTDNTETPDTMQATFNYPKFLTTYESRTCNPLPLFGRGEGAGTTIHGTEGDHLRESQRLLGDSQPQIVSGCGGVGKEPGNEPDERAALEKLGGMYQEPPEAHQRNRNLRAIFHDVPAGESCDALQDQARLGRGELDRCAFVSLAYGCSRQQRSLNQPFIRPSTTLGSAASGLPSLREMASTVARSAVDLGLGYVLATEVDRPGEGDVDGDVVGQLVGATTHLHQDGIYATARLHVEIGPQDGVLAHLEPHDPAHRDVLLERGLQLVDVVGALGGGLLALRRHALGQLVGER